MNADALGPRPEESLTFEQKRAMLKKIQKVRAAIAPKENGSQQFFDTMKWVINIHALETLFDDPWVPGNGLAVRDAEDLAAYLRRKHSQAQEEMRRMMLEEEGYDEDDSP